MDKRLTHPDYVDLSDADIVRYTKEGLRVYTQLYTKMGIALPLPSDRPAFEKNLWVILDGMAEVIAAELSNPGRQAQPDRDYWEGWQNNDPASRDLAVAAVRKATAAKTVEAAGANVVSLLWHKTMRH